MTTMKTLSDILRERNDLTEDEKLQFARFAVKHQLYDLSFNQLDRVYKFIRETIAENGG